MLEPRRDPDYQSAQPEYAREGRVIDVDNRRSGDTMSLLAKIHGRPGKQVRPTESQQR